MGSMADGSDHGKEHKRYARPSNVDMYEPMFFWIALLAISLMLKIALAYGAIVPAGTVEYTIISSVEQFLLFGPGIILLPLIAGAFVGREAGLASKGALKALHVGILNAVYGAIIYVICILIIYEVLLYAVPGSSMSAGSLLTYWILYPVLAFILVVEVFAALSHSRATVSS